jgi:hypothetical protein
MARLGPIIDPAADHAANLWVREECYRYYVRQRRRFCSYMEILDIWLRAPYCEDCIQSRWDWSGGLPDISGGNWEVDVLLHLGRGALRRAKAQLRRDRTFAWQCKNCSQELRPWKGDDVYVVSHHLEEHYGIPLETPGRKAPSKKLRSRIFELYDFRCFGCGRRKHDLHLDHIRPQKLGGDAAFRNLQPLCGRCGQRKGSAEPEEVSIDDDIYFRPPPSDSYEGLFW